MGSTPDRSTWILFFEYYYIIYLSGLKDNVSFLFTYFCLFFVQKNICKINLTIILFYAGREKKTGLLHLRPIKRECS